MINTIFHYLQEVDTIMFLHPVHPVHDVLLHVVVHRKTMCYRMYYYYMVSHDVHHVYHEYVVVMTTCCNVVWSMIKHSMLYTLYM